MEKMGNRFRRDVKAFATNNGVPILALKKPDRTRWDDRKLDHVRPYFEKAGAEGRTGVVAIVSAQEFQWVFSGKNRSKTPGSVSFDFVKEERRVGVYYFYIADADFGAGWPEEVRAVFVPTKRGVRTSLPSQTRVFSTGTEVKIDFTFKHSRVKQYLKEGRALRIETVINKPSDIGVLARLEHLPELVGRATQVNNRLLMIERAGQGCAIGSALFERIHQPYVWEGQRTGAFRFGDQRAMALAGSLCLVIHAVAGFTNKSLRGQVAGLLGRDYSSSQMSYALRRMRLHGLIERTPRTNTYTVTAEGIRVAVFYTKLRARLLEPLLEADKPPAPLELRRALTTIQRVLGDYVTNARLGLAA